MTGGRQANEAASVAAGARKRPPPEAPVKERPLAPTQSDQLERRTATMVVVSVGQEAGNSAGGASSAQQQFKVSPMRWLILLGVCAFGFLNGVSNEASSILNIYIQVLGLTISDYVYLNQIFFFVPFLAAFTAAGLTDRFGAKVAIFTALLLSVARNCARALLFAPHVAGWHHLRLLYWAFQRVFTQLTVSIYYCLPLKLAESWFAEEECSLALTLMLVLPVIGSACAALTYPRFVINLASIQPLAWVNLTCAIGSLCAVSLCFRRSKPSEGSPSARNLKNQAKLNEASAGLEPERLRAKLSKIFGNTQYLIYLLTMSVYDPLMWTISGILQDIFQSAGLTSIFCGQFLALSGVLGSLLQITCSLLWKAKRKRQQRESSHAAAAAELKRRESEAEASNRGQEEQPNNHKVQRDPFKTRKCKALLATQCAAFLLFCHALILHELYPSAGWLLQNQWWIILSASVVHLLVRYWAAAYYNDQCAELICGSISAPTSSACSMIISSIYSNLSSVIFVSLRQVERIGGGGALQVDDEHEVDLSDFPNFEALGTAAGTDEAALHQVVLRATSERAVYKRSVAFVALVAVCCTFVYLFKFSPNKRPAPQAQSDPGNAPVFPTTTTTSNLASATRYSTKL